MPNINLEKISESLILGTIKQIFFLLIGVIWILLFKSFKEQILQYNPLVLYSCLVLFLVVSISNIIYLTKIKDSKSLYTNMALYVSTVLVFFILTLFGDNNTLKNHIPFLISFGYLTIGQIMLESWFQQGVISNQKTEQGLGFASTAVVIEEVNSVHRFIIILNKNLREGKGLWVPPGGHFSPYTENPESKVIHKLMDEIGVECKLLEQANLLPNQNHDRENNEVVWITPPYFVLREYLPGKCKQDHSYHFDFVYICLTDGVRKNEKSKYKHNDIIRIPLNECLENFESTERAVRNKINERALQYGLTIGSRNDDIARDLIWRLHLSAKIFNSKSNE